MVTVCSVRIQELQDSKGDDSNEKFNLEKLFRFDKHAIEVAPFQPWFGTYVIKLAVNCSLFSGHYSLIY